MNDLLRFPSDRDPVWNRFLIRELVEEICESLAPQITAQGIELELDICPNELACADREMMRCAIHNLVLNALDAMPGGGELTVVCYVGTHALELEVADSGVGIAEDVRNRLFKPRVATKGDAPGHGLAIVDRIAKAHGGDITASNCPQGGTAFTLRIPYRFLEAAA